MARRDARGRCQKAEQTQNRRLRRLGVFRWCAALRERHPREIGRRQRVRLVGPELNRPFSSVDDLLALDRRESFFEPTSRPRDDEVHRPRRRKRRRPEGLPEHGSRAVTAVREQSHVAAVTLPRPARAEGAACPARIANTDLHRGWAVADRGHQAVISRLAAEHRRHVELETAWKDSDPRDRHRRIAVVGNDQRDRCDAGNPIVRRSHRRQKPAGWAPAGRRRGFPEE
jgi:phytoene dehydrogenase-like protein